MIWEYNAVDRYGSMKRGYFRETNGILFIYDITNRGSFNSLNYWLTEAKKYSNRGFLSILIGNKCDLVSEREVLYNEGQDLGVRLGIPFFETSAKDGTNIENIILALIEKNFELFYKFK